MDNAVDLWIFLEDLVEGFLICDIQLLKFWSLPRYQFNAINDFRRRVVQIVSNNHFVVGFKQRKGCKRPNVAGTTVRSDIISDLNAMEIVDHVANAYPVIKQVPTTILRVSVKYSFSSSPRGNAGDLQSRTREFCASKAIEAVKDAISGKLDIKVKIEPIDGCLHFCFYR